MTIEKIIESGEGWMTREVPGTTTRGVGLALKVVNEGKNGCVEVMGGYTGIHWKYWPDESGPAHYFWTVYFDHLAESQGRWGVAGAQKGLQWQKEDPAINIVVQEEVEKIFMELKEHWVFKTIVAADLIERTALWKEKRQVKKGSRPIGAISLGNGMFSFPGGAKFTVEVDEADIKRVIGADKKIIARLMTHPDKLVRQEVVRMLPAALREGGGVAI